MYDDPKDPRNLRFGGFDDSIEERVAWPLAGGAIEAGDTAAFQQVLLDYPALLENRYLMESLTTEAVDFNRWEILTIMLKAGCDADPINGSGGTPLIDAAWLGHLEVARVLL